MSTLESISKNSTVLFLGNNDESTDHRVTELANQYQSINCGLITDPRFTPDKFGYFHTTIVDIPFGQLLDLAQRFDLIVMLDQPQSQWSHWKCLSATFKLMVQLEELNKATIFRENKNAKKIQYWIDLVYKKK